MHRPNIARRVLVLLAVMAGGWVAWAAWQPRPGPPRVSFTLTGYTNGGPSGHLAQVLVSNLNAAPVKFQKFYQIQVATARGWTSATSGYFKTGPLLGVGGCTTLAVPAPAGKPWRIYLNGYTDDGHTAVTLLGKLAIWPRLVLGPKQAAVLYGVISDPLENPQPAH